MAAGIVKVLESQVVYEGPVFGVRRDHLREPGGVEVIRDVVTHSGSIVLLPIFPDGRILLVRQYRHAVGRFLWELVAGRIERGESPLEAAQRELAEETGYSAKRFRKLLEFFPTPGFVSERMVIYTAEDLHPGLAHPEADERITKRRFRLAELKRWIRAGKLQDAKAVAGILYYAQFGLPKNQRRGHS